MTERRKKGTDRAVEGQNKGQSEETLKVKVWSKQGGKKKVRKERKSR
jgi:hypothetical protein